MMLGFIWVRFFRARRPILLKPTEPKKRFFVSTTCPVWGGAALCSDPAGAVGHGHSARGAAHGGAVHPHRRLWHPGPDGRRRWHAARWSTITRWVWNLSASIPAISAARNRSRWRKKPLPSGPMPGKVVDPVMGDNGKAYATVTPAFIDRIGSLTAQADLILPNATEAALLLQKATLLTAELDDTAAQALADG